MNWNSMRTREQHKDKRVLGELLESLLRHPGCCDEVWLSSDYGCPELPVHALHAQQMGEAAALFRANGIKASLQISNTIGHDDTQFALNHRGITWQRMVGHDGVQAECVNCPRDTDFLRYVFNYTRMYAAWKPDYVWVDDDLRMDNHSPVIWGCFCEGCLRAFSEKTGREWSREELVRAVNREESHWREKWVAFGRESLAGVMRTVCRAVMEVSPDSVVGYEHGGFDWTVYIGGDHAHVFDVIREETGRPPATRAGAGYYTDHAPRDVLIKAYSLNLQHARLPEYVTDTRPEVENYTHTAMGKSPHGTVLEAALHLAFGSRNLSFAVLVEGHETSRWYEGHMSRMAQWAPYWKRFLAHNEGTVPAGLQIAFSRSHHLREMDASETDFAWAAPRFLQVSPMAAMGLPMCYNDSPAPGTLLHPDAADGMGPDELEKLFAGGVLTDGETLFRLKRRGLLGLTGLEVQPMKANSGRERLTEHPINGGFAGRLWMQYLYGGDDCYSLSAPEQAQPQLLGEYVDGDGRVMGNATLLAVTPAEGRLAVFGYHFWQPVVSSGKRNQILKAADWVSGGKLPVLLETAAQAAVVARCDGEGRLRSVTLVNVSIDVSPRLRLRLHGASETAVWVQPEREQQVLESEDCGDWRWVTVPPMAPWSIGVIEL